MYRAKSLGVEGFEKVVAIKRVLPHLAEDDEFALMFIEEAKIAGQLQHANIAAIFELGIIDDVHFIAMEYVFGKNVRDIMDAQRASGRMMPTSLAAWIASQLLAGLDYAHRKRDPSGRPMRIIHRDVSPPNVLVSYDGLVKIVDFGIAKAASRAVQTHAGVIKGKLAYMSPEQLMGHDIDHRSDVFAASVILHELLTGERLFGGDNDFEVTEKVRAAEASPPSARRPEVSAALDRVVMRGLARDRTRRWQTAGEMQEALIAAVAAPGVRFGAAALRDWIRIAFAEDYAVEKAKLERLAAVEREGVELSEDGPTASDPEPLPFEEDEATVISVPPDLSAPPPIASAPTSNEFVELSSLVMVDESISAFDIEVDVDAPVYEAPPPAPLDLPPAPRAPAAEALLLSEEEPTQLDDSRQASSRPSAAPTQVAHAAEREDVRPPSIRFSTQPASPTPSPAPSAPAEEEGGGTPWGTLALVAILALALGVGGVVLALYLTGQGLPF